MSLDLIGVADFFRHQIHFYVPEEIGNTDKVKAHDIQAAKEEIREFLFRPR